MVPQDREVEKPSKRRSRWELSDTRKLPKPLRTETQEEKVVSPEPEASAEHRGDVVGYTTTAKSHSQSRRKRKSLMNTMASPFFPLSNLLPLSSLEKILQKTAAARETGKCVPCRSEQNRKGGGRHLIANRH